STIRPTATGRPARSTRASSARRSALPSGTNEPRMSSTATRAEASIYDPKVALEFFKAAGKPEKVAEGRTIFAEKEKSIFSRNKPAFALMLMSMRVRRLRETIRSLEAAGDIAPEAMAKESAAFDPKHLGELVKGLSDEPVVYFNSGRAIMQAGQAGVRMYVVT